MAYFLLFGFLGSDYITSKPIKYMYIYIHIHIPYPQGLLGAPRDLWAPSMQPIIWLPLRVGLSTSP